MQQLRRWWSRIKAPAQIATPGFMRAGILDGPYSPDTPGYALPDAQAELYQRLSWVYIAVSITAQTAAGIPFQVQQLKGEKKQAVENHPFEQLLRRPNPLQSRFEFLEALFGYRQVTGNAYVWLNRPRDDENHPTGPPSEMWVIPTPMIEPIPDQKLFIRGYAYDPGIGQIMVLEPWEICHLKRFHPRNRFVGLSAIEALALTATGDLAMTKWNTRFFDKEHAKPSGALAFADPINDSDWETMKRDIQDQHGGTERRLMLLRNAGKSGVSWLQFGVNQRDMEFLAGRTFNKEEIYAALAPGLSSMLAVNATEANSTVGKATFNEMTIWPIHQAVAEKFSNDILPSYGENLVGEFEDVRVTDRALELQEQQAAYRLLTVKEAREKFYNLPPLGDERDEKLVDGEAAPGINPVPPQLAAFAGQDNPPAAPEPPKADAPPAPDAEEETEPASKAKGSLGQPDAAVILKLADVEDLLFNQQMLQRMFESSPLRLTPIEQLHLTLVETPLIEASTLTELANRIGAQFRQEFTLHGTLAKVFPSPSGATPVVLLIEPDEELRAFQAEIVAQFQARGIPLSEYSHPEQWIPHITLGYLDTVDIGQDWMMPFEWTGRANWLVFSRRDFESMVSFTVNDSASINGEGTIRADLLHWQRKAYKRAKYGQRPACAFESEVIPASLSAAVKGALEAAQTALDVRRLFGTLLDLEPDAERMKAATWAAYP